MDAPIGLTAVEPGHRLAKPRTALASAPAAQGLLGVVVRVAGESAAGSAGRRSAWAELKVTARPLSLPWGVGGCRFPLKPRLSNEGQSQKNPTQASI